MLKHQGKTFDTRWPTHDVLFKEEPQRNFIKRMNKDCTKRNKEKKIRPRSVQYSWSYSPINVVILPAQQRAIRLHGPVTLDQPLKTMTSSDEQTAI